jgi:hypothetical protein
LKAPAGDRSGSHKARASGAGSARFGPKGGFRTFAAATIKSPAKMEADIRSGPRSRFVFRRRMTAPSPPATFKLGSLCRSRTRHRAKLTVTAAQLHFPRRPRLVAHHFEPIAVSVRTELAFAELDRISAFRRVSKYHHHFLCALECRKERPDRDFGQRGPTAAPKQCCGRE